MNIPIVVAAFGTTSRAIQTYDVMNTIFRQRFAGYEIHWALFLTHGCAQPLPEAKTAHARTPIRC